MSSRSKSSKYDLISPNTKNYFHVSGSFIIILYNLLIISYIVQLEDKKCGCITDWRHDFIKYFSISIVVWGAITIVFELGTSKNSFVKLIKNILNCAALINIWCLYTYVGDLDKSNCMCAISDQKNMHYFLYIWRYVLVGSLMLALLSIITLTLHSK
jgi:hypothetical protein